MYTAIITIMTTAIPVENTIVEKISTAAADTEPEKTGAAIRSICEKRRGSLRKNFPILRLCNIIMEGRFFYAADFNR